MNILELAHDNLCRISDNVYPGRGIIIGLNQDQRTLTQIYWIMGRSSNSRNRVFVREGDFVRTEAHDPDKVTDSSLIIYNPIKSVGRVHIVSNGDQTDTVYNFISEGESMEEALFTRVYEPDAPNFTPRITGMIDLNSKYAYQLSILKLLNSGDVCGRFYYNYETAIPGVGHCLHTYNGDGDPLPSFSGEPFPVEISGNIDQIADLYWGLLNEENRISLLVKTIDRNNGDTEIVIRNKH
ncbi:IMP cyclohydrolase [Paenibacillus sp. FJAT-26967]|uniref:IMP cyclohydrolase n=1 Tax=Paenibacillus sp. FJAT-26967 TaxID=1729690 RepID=UPI000837C975|nr:IMP cyclohydrolase [Paenibacillus sp. FJAT-26967]